MSRKRDVWQARRVRVALSVSAVFVCLFIFLFIQQNLEYRVSKTSVLGYLTTESMMPPIDPLGITSSSLELVGVSPDGMVVGYATDCTVSQTMMEIDRAMRAQGWSVLAMDTEGISSYVWLRDASANPWEPSATSTSQTPQTPQTSLLADQLALMPQSSPQDAQSRHAPQAQIPSLPQGSETSSAYVLFICSERSGGSAVVAELL